MRLNFLKALIGLYVDIGFGRRHNYILVLRDPIEPRHSQL